MHHTEYWVHGHSWVPVNYTHTAIEMCIPCHVGCQETTYPMWENQIAFVASPLCLRQAGPGGVQAGLLNSGSSHSKDGFEGVKMLVQHTQSSGLTFTLRKHTGFSHGYSKIHLVLESLSSPTTEYTWNHSICWGTIVPRNCLTENMSVRSSFG